MKAGPLPRTAPAKRDNTGMKMHTCCRDSGNYTQIPPISAVILMIREALKHFGMFCFPRKRRGSDAGSPEWQQVAGHCQLVERAASADW